MGEQWRHRPRGNGEDFSARRAGIFHPAGLLQIQRQARQREAGLEAAARRVAGAQRAASQPRPCGPRERDQHPVSAGRQQPRLRARQCREQGLARCHHARRPEFAEALWTFTPCSPGNPARSGLGRLPRVPDGGRSGRGTAFLRAGGRGRRSREWAARHPEASRGS